MSNFLNDEDTGLFAAEYVLGTLDVEERARAQTLLGSDHGFIGMVRIWERRLGELHLMVEPLEPEPKIWERIKPKIAEAALAKAKASAPQLPPIPAVPAAPPAAAAPADPAVEVVPGVPISPDAPESLNSEPSEPPKDDTAAPTPPAATGEAADVLQNLADELAVGAERSPESVVRSERGVDAPSQVPVVVPVVVPPAVPVARKDATTDMIRSRGRWRALAIVMTLMIAAVLGLLSAWKFVPGRVPPQLQPSRLLTALGIGQGMTLGRKPAPPESQFDE